jgi:hypothetical protein
MCACECLQFEIVLERKASYFLLNYVQVRGGGRTKRNETKRSPSIMSKTSNDVLPRQARDKEKDDSEKGSIALHYAYVCVYACVYACVYVYYVCADRRPAHRRLMGEKNDHF